MMDSKWWFVTLCLLQIGCNDGAKQINFGCKQSNSEITYRGNNRSVIFDSRTNDGKMLIGYADSNGLIGDYTTFNNDDQRDYYRVDGLLFLSSSMFNRESVRAKNMSCSYRRDNISKNILHVSCIDTLTGFSTNAVYEVNIGIKSFVFQCNGCKPTEYFSLIGETGVGKNCH